MTERETQSTFKLSPVPVEPTITAPLNDSQKLHLRVSCQHIDQLLSRIEEVLHSAESKSPFPKYIVDMSPAQMRVVEDYIRRLRAQLVRALAWQNIDASEPTIPASRAISVDVAFIDIALDELRPSQMRGAGSLSPDAALQLTGVVRELGALSEGLSHYMTYGLNSSMKDRLGRLEEAGQRVQLLALVEDIVTRQGMVEFRPRLDSLTSRLEDTNFEVAVFGRVSSGKSSLLNKMLGYDLLPVGINPITAVPTRLEYGPAVKAIVTFGASSNQEVSIEEFAGLVSERGNPGNSRHVTRALIEVPSKRLHKGIVLVDTPGLGSLARKGAAETLAYLPSCDLAILLVDGGSTLNEEDIGTLRAIDEAGIESLVLLSKADLLSDDDIEHAKTYMHDQVQKELHRAVAVHPVSALPNDLFLLNQFFQEELLPRFEHAQVLRNESVARKVEILRQSLIASLESRIGRQERQGRQEVRSGEDLSKVEASLREIAGEVGQLNSDLDRKATDLRQSISYVLDDVAEEAVQLLSSTKAKRLTSLELSEFLHRAVEQRIESIIVSARNVGQRALASLRAVGQSLGRPDLPNEKDLDPLLRDMPRFEITSLPSDIEVGVWGSLGRSALVFHLRKELHRHLDSLLKERIEAYSSNLWQWARHFGQRLDLLISSYADGYRVQIQELSGYTKDEVDVGAMKKDLELLLHWMDSGKDSKDVAQQIGA